VDEIIELVKDEMATAVQTDNDNQIEDDSIPTNQSINHSLTHSLTQSINQLGIGLQLLLVFIVKSAKNVIKN
jgi:hypothetical protein